MRAFLVALGFLTRVPVPATSYGDARHNAESLVWYPLVGALIGALLATAAWLLGDTPALLRGALLLLAWVALTGGLHLDGLADSADAWVGGMGDRLRTLEIMQDPRSGPAGVSAVVLLLLLKFAALASLPLRAWPVVLLAPMLARALVVVLFLTTPYVRAGGLGAALQQAPRRACVLMLGVAALVCVASGWRGVGALLAGGVVFGCWRRAGMRRLGGFTGDTAGALIETSEAAVLVVSVVLV